MGLTVPDIIIALTLVVNAFALLASKLPQESSVTDDLGVVHRIWNVRCSILLTHYCAHSITYYLRREYISCGSTHLGLCCGTSCSAFSWCLSSPVIKFEQTSFCCDVLMSHTRLTVHNISFLCTYFTQVDRSICQLTQSTRLVSKKFHDDTCSVSNSPACTRRSYTSSINTVLLTLLLLKLY
jgi:hypothetical protein